MRLEAPIAPCINAMQGNYIAFEGKKEAEAKTNPAKGFCKTLAGCGGNSTWEEENKNA